MRFVIFRTMLFRQFRWRLVASNNKIIANSGESYHNRADCIAAIELVKQSGLAPTKFA